MYVQFAEIIDDFPAPLKLVNGSVFGEGDVLVYDSLSRQWRHVCSTQWTLDETKVVCRQLGFAGAFSGESKYTPYIV